MEQTSLIALAQQCNCHGQKVVALGCHVNIDYVAQNSLVSLYTLSSPSFLRR